MCPVQRTGTNKRRRLLSLLKPGSPSFETRRAVYRNFTYRFTGFVREATLFEQLKAAPRRGQAPTRRPACCRYWEQNRDALRRNEMESSSEERRRCICDSRRTCRRPFVQLSLHSGADATRVGVKRCQVHLCRRPPPLKSSIQKLQPENDLRVVAESVSMSPVVWKRHNATGL